MIELSLEQVKALKPCSESKIPDFKNLKTMNTAQALEAGVSIRDLLWVAGKLGKTDLCKKFALGCARNVEHLDKSGLAKACNDANEEYLNNPTKENLKVLEQKRKDAYAANAAVYAVANAAVYAAVYAVADAVYAVANAAVYAVANAAVYAAADDAVYAVAKQKEIEFQKQLFVEIFQ